MPLSPDDPRHGSHAGERAHWKAGEPTCEACRVASRAYQRRMEKRRQLGYLNQVPLSYRGVWDNLQTALAWGFSKREIATFAGLPEGSYRFWYGGPDQKVLVETWRKLATATPQALGPTHIGTLRRLQALQRVGWSTVAIADYGNTPKYGLRCILRGQRNSYIQRDYRLRIAAIYKDLAYKTPPPGVGTTRAKNKAASLGWASPMAWDEIDNPDEKPHVVTSRNHYQPQDSVDEAAVLRRMAGDRSVIMHHRESAEVVRRLAERGHQQSWINAQTGLKSDRYREAYHAGRAVYLKGQAA